jgi:hypothetical protein
MFDVSSELLQIDIPCSKRERLFKGRSKALRQGEQPQEENGAIDVKGGELITLM